jgi:hypothetical protein
MAKKRVIADSDLGRAVGQGLDPKHAKEFKQLLVEVAYGFGRDPRLMPWLMRQVKDAARLEREITRILKGDGPVSREVRVVISSAKRSVMICRDGRAATAFLVKHSAGTSKRVDHARGVALLREVMPLLRELRRSVKTAANPTAEWKRLKLSEPTARRLVKSGLAAMFAAAIEDSAIVPTVAAHLVAKEATDNNFRTPIPAASVILRDAASKRYRSDA